MDVRLTNVYVADAKLVAEGVAQPEDAMAVFVGRAGRGRVAPFTVQRSYTGAGGWYTEYLALLAPNGDVAWRSPAKALTLRGSSKVDTFTEDVHGVDVDSDEDHELVFLMSDGRGAADEIGRVPLAVLDEDPPGGPASETAVLDEALKKSTIVWIDVPGPGGTNGRPVPAWYGTLDGRVYVLTGGSEQRIPGLAEADRVELVARSKELQSLVARVTADARVVPESDPLFARVTPVLLPRRLNLRDGEQAAERWRQECTLVELTPTGVPAEA
ncbi:MAG TPA: hypothetical protein VNK73_01055 [Actinomycetota bacterium]|jgi:hypothetical protein|nr:hypothetical protein [Actinomycetota bacterium]